MKENLMKKYFAFWSKLAAIALVSGTTLGFVSNFWTSYTVHPTTDAARASTTVMITNFERTSGGTGVIYKSNKTESYILTNGHVCGLLKTGGLVSGENFSIPAASFRQSEQHDLCLVKVNRNLKVSTEVASDAPDLYSEAYISGHPALMSTLETHGSFSSHMIIQVLTGFRPCTAEDEQGDNAILCLFLGGIPVIKTYDAQPSSALIMPGSSGSAVFNKDGYIAALVFAGAGGGVGYSFLVPQEYISNFVNAEVHTLPVQTQDASLTTQNDRRSRARLKNYCENRETNMENTKLIPLCDTVYNF